MSTDVKKPDAEVAKPDLVTATIDGIQVSVPKGTLVIRAAERMGIEIPRFCDHELLDPVAACRQCIVEVPDGGNGRPMKPQPACALAVMPNMVVETAATNEKVAKHQEGMLEFLLINHPLDCPICDKGGECPLQNQTMSHGPGESRYEGLKRTYPKPVNISPQILIDRERCVLCQRCTRFGEQISGDDFISLSERGGLSQINIYASRPYVSYFSGNIVQICPVGALTSADYRFQARPFDLVSTTTTCEHCASGCELRTDHRHFQVKRRLAGNDPEVNEQWNCDKGRFGFYYGRQADRLTNPLVRRNGKLEPASWPEAIDAAVNGLKDAGAAAGVLTGGRLTLENAFAYSKFARTVLGTNSIDFRSRAYGADEAGFLAADVAGAPMDVTFADLEKTGTVVLVGFEPEEESSAVFLRLRKGYRKNRTKVLAVAPFLTNGSKKMGATLVAAAPGEELKALDSIAGELTEGTIVLVGERASLTPGLLAKIRGLSAKGVRWAWIPRRAGELAALEAGCLPGLLPGGRPATDASARVDLQAAWGVDHLPEDEGLDAEGMLAAAGSGELKALVTAAVDLADMNDPEAAQAALASDGVFVVSLEQRRSSVTEVADVVFPVALLEDQLGTFINWEHRVRPVNIINAKAPSVMTDVRVLAALADAFGSDLGMRTPPQAQAAFAEISDWEGARPGFVSQPARASELRAGESQHGLKLASWHQAVDDSRCLDGAETLKMAAPAARVRISQATAEQLGAADGTTVTISTQAGSVELPAEITASMVDDVVWAPTNSGAELLRLLHVRPGERVQVSVVTTAGGAA
ncbi:NADH-quinone oxidoreductase subunit G [Propionimicrobium sp. PCR01-08-3]|uniref:NADH-quinone oxidoreductase subunit G n=1 Tax=Propionimicrobium sp. PCR01-08-3 TaxID=3052086 RepID=UPI00255C5AD0|nr:NADH-quinone oxidoreductase subunit G [Propionimicrobium sp. PCR01-08-3]WIY83128.1 NADH-quinone oxidoreductase subunit G [Propionimicrobium sp. PCR01-08-3]